MSLAKEVANKLRREILIGNFKPGDRILESEVSAMMKTSRGPVRDALVRLEHEGLVVRQPNHSAVVVSMTVEDVEEVCSLRFVLEKLALRYTCDRAQEEDILRLSESVGLLRRCLREHFTLEEAVDLDLQFHEEFMKAAKHNRVLSIWQSIRPQIWFLIFSRNAFDIRHFEDSVISHEELVNSIRKKDQKSGEANIKKHLGTDYSNLVDIYTKIHLPTEPIT
jgi:DNA-binding GntR family transcriptional regulator